MMPRLNSCMWASDILKEKPKQTWKFLKERPSNDWSHFVDFTNTSWWDSPNSPSALCSGYIGQLLYHHPYLPPPPL